MDHSILVVNDLHVGSVYGLLPPNFKSSSGAVIGQNPGQKHLWRCWKELARRVSKIKISAVVVNGDAIDGPQVKSRGQESCLPDLNDQERAAVDVLQYLFDKLAEGPSGKNFERYFVQGTEYHDGRGAENFENVARELKGEKYRGLGTGVHSKEVLDLEIEGVVINFAHHVGGGGGGITRGNALDKEMIMSALAGKLGKFPKADCLVRAHMHFFCHVEHGSKHGAIAPAWQLQTRFMRHRSVYQMVPDIGALLLHISPEKKAAGFDPVQIQKLLFPLPPIKTHRMRS